ncbi:hypothetical protein HNP37_004599 [Flavobacterium nitrogenifigens]|uniref:Uncharacterized protein n=2 Tax=Flavobacterium TaxID=237 RepID=A0A7W7J2D6_9FLAO|nr:MULTISPECIES: hypothetical protein [Flavobacterium]MBB4804507.1 hypothetical protein [Flavobacterium nitrogenifigens]MBB6389365.1 hypothetical protein [Flavobacterium notoginsengisoli]
MKATDFFIQKSESFLEELSAVELVPIQSRDFKDDFYMESLEKWHEDFFTLMSELENIRSQMELMFLEFDQGNYFLGKLNDFIPETEDVNKYYLHYLVKINLIFIAFLYE